MIENRQLRFKKLPTIGTASLGAFVEQRLEQELEGRALRWYIAEITDREIVVEATLSDSRVEPLGEGVGDRFHAGKCVALHAVPTGVGCEVGGYAGDAAPATELLAKAVDYVITNPNAVNASSFIHLGRNVLYTEGLMMDAFLKGQIDLCIPHANKVGLIIEQTTPGNLDTVYNIVNTVRAVHGIEMVDPVVTDGPIGSRAVMNDSGAYVGTIDHPEQIDRGCAALLERGAEAIALPGKAGKSLKRSVVSTNPTHAPGWIAAARLEEVSGNIVQARQLIDRGCAALLERGAEAIAITTNIQDLPHDEYVRHFDGELPNPMGGVEAIISHRIVQSRRLPAAHAPMINLKQLDLSHPVVDARGAGEMASVSGLACVLIGLSRAPQIRLDAGPRIADAINIHNLLAVVLPAGCLGGIPAIYADRLGVPILAVRDNHTVLDVTAERAELSGVIEVQGYAEAAGVLLALRHGISLEGIRRPIETKRPPGRRLRRLSLAKATGG